MQHQKSIQARNHRSGFGTSVQARLAASIVAILGVAATSESSMASTIVVSRCNDLPPGHGVKGESLRTAIGKAVDADLVDLSGLDTSCSTITLQSGEIPIGLANLAIRGPTGHVLTIDGNHVGRVFYHSGKGVLTISSLSLANGRTSGNGGCLYSNGAVMLDHLSVTGCHAVNGGGVFSSGPTPSNVAKYPTTLAFVTLSGNVADQTGGGIYNQSLLTLQSSLVDGNTAAFVGGGVFDNGTTPTSDFPPTYGTTYIQATVVSGNSARYQGGGISTSGPLITTYSTISDNKSYLLGGGGVAVFANF
ncbi:MAG: hypothetical protein ABJB01_07030, partial [Rudaea sp.]